MRSAAVGGAALVLLAACGGSGPGGSSTAHAATPAPVPTIAAIAAAKPAPGALKTFGDWAVGCDNLLTCKAAALAPEAGEPPALLMAITRAAGPAGAVTVDLVSGTAIALPVRITVDGKPAGEGGRAHEGTTRIDGDMARRIVAAAANGRSLAVSDGGKAAASTLSLTGLAAALRYIDDRQGRAGTTGALVAHGAGADRRAAPPAPVITAIDPIGAPARPSPQQLAQFRKAGSCEDDMAINTAEPPETHALGGGVTLLLLPCSAGAYNVSMLVYVGDARGFRPAAFDSPPGMGEPGGDPEVVNGQWERALLTSYVKARGLGDCGVSASYAWDGKRFRLVEQAEMSECRGNTDFIRTWHADVRRRRAA